MSVELKFGDIIDIYRAKDIDGNRKLKIAVCVEPGEYWFFYINSHAYSFAAEATMELTPADLDRLKHKSYLVLYGHPVKADDEEIASIDMSRVYRFKNPERYDTMMYILENSHLLSEEQKSKIRKCYMAGKIATNY